MAKLREKLKFPEKKMIEEEDMSMEEVPMEEIEEEMPMEEEEVGIDLASISDEDLLDEVKARGLQI